MKSYSVIFSILFLIFTSCANNTDLYTDGMYGYASSSSLDDSNGYSNIMASYIGIQKEKIKNGELPENNCLGNYSESVMSTPTKKNLFIKEYYFGKRISREEMIIVFDFNCVLNEKQRQAWATEPSLFLEKLSEKIVNESLQ